MRAAMVSRLRLGLLPRRSAARLAVLSLAVFLCLVAAARVAGTPDLLSSGSVGAGLRFTLPILLAGLGGLWAERAGTINIGLDGMMVIGTWSGAWVGLSYGPWAALAGGALGGAVAGLVQAAMMVGLGIDQAIAGIVTNLVAVGVVRLASSLAFADLPGGSISQSPRLQSLPEVSVPGADTALRAVVSLDLPVVSELASVLLGLSTQLSVGTLVGLALIPVTWYVLWRTRLGLRLRACGENPAAVDALGVSPWRMRTLAQTVSGAFAGLGGAYLVVVASSLYREGQVAGRGFIGLATVVFGNWRPGGVAVGSLLFGFTDALSTRQAVTVRAFLLLGALALVLLAARGLRKGRRGLSTVQGVGALALLGWFVSGVAVPSEVVNVAPYLATLVVLMTASQTLRPPAAVGVTYRRDENA